MEYWDIYDRNKKKTGRTMKRNDWNMKDGDYHLSVLGLVRRSDGRFLITRRKLDKEWAPGWWEVPGGGVRAGESSFEAVVREVAEETGLDVRDCPGGFAFDYRRDNPQEKNNYFVDIYIFQKDFDPADIHLQEEETTAWKAADLEEIRQLAGQGIFLHYDSIRQAFERPQTMKERLDRQFAFIREIDKEKFVSRQTYVSDGSRMENDAEHAWHMAVMAYLLSDYSNEKIDVLHTVMMLLIHDLVEIYAGDTYAYDEQGHKTQKKRETDAADRLYSLLPEDQAAKLRDLWDEFEAWDSPEARFAHVMDNLQPLMLNAATGGRSWKEHGIHLSQPLGRNARTAEGSYKLWDYAFDNFIRPSVENGVLKDDTGDAGE